ncbi:hypothetical protein GCM10011581_48200 [Saccharopolyspora subtropica]|uniref:Peptidase E n=1 Tax=Saccharopolyspora thermophila TaxID=89367 RepID=A0A917KBF3_9PSEU|nr:hypothetical protein GCM10011581_48200 [Saccharopolyspora subtropica]
MERFRNAFSSGEVEFSSLTLFDKPNVPDVAAHLRQQDVIWVDRGSLANLLAVWRAHQLDGVLRECWEAGVVLVGESAGSLCWFASGTTDSFGDVRAFTDGLALLPYANAVHYEKRRPQFQRLIGEGVLPLGFATDVGAGLHFEGTELVAAISDRRNAGAYRVERTDGGTVLESALEVRRLKRF